MDNQTEPNILNVSVSVTPTVFVCSHCDNEHGIINLKEHNNKKYCEECFDNLFYECYRCCETGSRDDVYSYNDYLYCDDCFYQDHFYCCRCDEPCHVDDAYRVDGNEEDYYCEICYNRTTNNESINWSSFLRNYDKSNRLVEPQERAFSTEIECYYPTGEALKTVATKISPLIGITTDGSLGNKGLEFITPKLSGKRGRKALRKLCNELKDNKFTVDKTCGLHIHLDTSDIKDNYIKIKNLFMFYLAFEPVIFSYLPISRRKNRYCLPLTEFYHEKEVSNCNDLTCIDKLWYREQSLDTIKNRKTQRYDSSRYSGINLHSLLSNGHIEIRYHSGTLIYNKIIKWIELHIAILNYIANSNESYNVENQLRDIKYQVSLKEKQDKMFQLLNLPKNLQSYFKDRQNKFMPKTKRQTTTTITNEIEETNIN